MVLHLDMNRNPDQLNKKPLSNDFFPIWTVDFKDEKDLPESVSFYTN